ncbi:MAG: 1-deoxy-D-xylulose-5-phosphate synthase [Oscillospiraceae bacterium]|jgi:1-deoxy-D-xylulose-5-phosphate synthase|nr:1-deoxy-D-xylulose-5-phosphate synthase [Oscillospiraceae bacterium]
MTEPLLPHIHSPADLRRLPPEQYERLAQEIRGALVQTVTRNGGHLASNLGVVELTMALHLCFDSPNDALVWDVSHQSYPHKLLTGRYEQFAAIRQSHGLSGFTSPAESEHDFFYAGHASTSISSALGLAEAKALRGDPHFTIAILGDGALTGGLAYEALNNAGRSRANLIVVLNDNEMSISRNVGALSHYLSRVRSRPEYRRTKRRVERALRKIPLIGGELAVGAAAIKRLFKRLLTNTTLFEDLGLDYIGPVDGHDLKQLCAALESAKLTPRPALVHVRTIKGKGLERAEAAPDQYHGVAQYEDAAEPTAPGTCCTDAFSEELCALAAIDPRICAVTAAMSLGTGLDAFRKRFPERFFDVGIAEAHAVTFAAGLAKQGMRPVVAVYATFLQRAFDQLLHDAALQGLPLVLAVDRSGFVGLDGATHHGLYDVAMCAGIPGATVYSPATCGELRGALRQAMRAPGLTVIRYPRGTAIKGEQTPPLLQSADAFELYGDPAAKIAVVTYGRLFFAACKAAAPLKICKLKRVLPLDPAAAEAVLHCDRVCFFEEGMRSGGVGERFALALLERRFAGEFRLAAVEGFPRHAPAEELLAEYGLDTAGIERLCRE